MGQKTSIRFGNEDVQAEELEFDPLRESWNEYRTEDGTLVKMKTVVAKILRLDKYTPDGDPIYHVTSSNVVAVTVQPNLKKKG